MIIFEILIIPILKLAALTFISHLAYLTCKL